MRTSTLSFVMLLILCVPVSTAIRRDRPGILPTLADKLPPRSESAMTGAEFAKAIAEKEGRGREQAIEEQLLAGNMPDFLKELKPVRLGGRLDNGKTVEVTIFVTPDYLAVGPTRIFSSHLWPSHRPQGGGRMRLHPAHAKDGRCGLQAIGRAFGAGAHAGRSGDEDHRILRDPRRHIKRQRRSAGAALTSADLR